MARAGRVDAVRQSEVPRIELTPADTATEQLWLSALALVNELNRELDGEWTLVGGLMVQLHVNRYGDGSARPTDDVDVLGDSRTRPSATERIARLLLRLKFTLSKPVGVDLDTAYRFTRGDEVVDVLGPDGTRQPPKTVGRFETIQVTGGTQALNRTETVLVRAAGAEAAVPCPTLLGAILLKARAITSPQRDQDREDLIRLLLCVEDPRAMHAEMKNSERSWLRRAGKHLRLDAGDLGAIFSEEQLATARVTYNLLTQD
jgi:hypothetical protein